MNHIDEGTMHAWLDGAVDEAKAREIEAHLAGCAQCAAAVAEARGLVAASSRILTALDDVPGGVVPKRAPSPAAPQVAPARRQWRAAPWVGAIAAGLVLAVGINVYNSRADRRMESVQASMQLEAPRVGVLSNSAPPALDSLRSTPGAPAERFAAAPSVAQRRAGISARPSVAAASPAQAREPNVTARLDAATSALAGNVPGKKEAAATEAAAAVGERDQRENKLALADTARALAKVDSAMSRVAGVSVRGGVDTARIETTAAKSMVGRDERGRVAGLSQVAPARAVGASEDRRFAPSLDVARLAGCYRTDSVPPVVRLDSARSAPGFLVRAERSDSALGWWRPLTVDALGAPALRVNLTNGPVFTIRASSRVACAAR